MEAKAKLTEYLERLPDVSVIRRKLGANLRERDLLRQLLRLAEKKQKVRAEADKEPAR